MSFTPLMLAALLAAAEPADAEFAILEPALERALKQPDPRDHLYPVARTAVNIDTRRGTDLIRRATGRIEEAKLPPVRLNHFAHFAAMVAPFDADLRDALLKRAIAEAERALRTDPLWKAQPTPPGVKPFMDPQKALDQEKQ